VKFHAGDYVELYAGFEAQLGTNFLATIVDCNPATNLNDPTDNVFQSNLEDDEVEIEFILEKSSYMKIDLYDSNFKKVLIISEEIFEQGEHNFTFPISDLSQGVYLIQFESAEKIEHKKIFIK